MRQFFFNRSLFAFGILGLVALLIIARLVSLQLYSHESLLRESDHQRTTAQGLFERGSIFFLSKDGNKISAASLARGYTLAIVPKSLPLDEDVCAKIKIVYDRLDCERFDLLSKKVDDPYEEVATKVSDEVGKQIDSLRIPGVQLIKEQWRYYPAGTLAAHVIGFYGYGSRGLDGVYGVERYYKDVLARTTNPLTTNFFSELFSDTSDMVGGIEQEGDVVLTIDPAVQSELEKQIALVAKEWGSRKVMGIIMDPRTGALIAMAQYPTYDPNTYGDTSSAGVFTLSLVEHVYEMGSIMKILTYAAGVDSGAINEKSTYYDTGSREIQGKTFGNFDGIARGTVSIKEVLRQSLNIGAAHIAELVGAKTFTEYFIERYKLDEETGIDLPGEVRGLMSNLERTTPISLATASYGQGIATTPIATMRALAAVANGGFMVQPHVVHSIARQGGIDSVFDYSDQKVRILKPETTESVSRVLATIVDEKLGEGKYKIEHHSVAAKTGTAQIPKPSVGYYDDRYLHSFFGYVPAYDAQYAVLLLNLEPHGAQYSSETLSKPFINMVQFLINYYSITPDR